LRIFFLAGRKKKGAGMGATQSAEEKTEAELEELAAQAERAAVEATDTANAAKAKISMFSTAKTREDADRLQALAAEARANAGAARENQRKAAEKKAAEPEGLLHGASNLADAFACCHRKSDEARVRYNVREPRNLGAEAGPHEGRSTHSSLGS